MENPPTRPDPAPVKPTTDGLPGDEPTPIEGMIPVDKRKFYWESLIPFGLAGVDPGCNPCRRDRDVNPQAAARRLAGVGGDGCAAAGGKPASAGVRGWFILLPPADAADAQAFLQ